MKFIIVGAALAAISNACNVADITNGIKGIESSVTALSAAIAGLPNGAGCPSAAKGPPVTAAVSLIAKINAEATSLANCGAAVNDCGVIQAEITGGLLPKVTALSTIIVARSSIICCNTLGAVLRGQANSISNAVVAYAKSIAPKIPAGNPCQSYVTADRDAITAVITRITNTVACP